MQLNDQQQDCLTEICNIGTSRAASQLSLLLNDNIKVDVPMVKISTIAELPSILGLDTEEKFVAVSQRLAGCFNGEAILLFNNDDCKVLVESVLQGFGGISSPNADIYKQESMVEIGNIIVSASISSLADILKSEVLLSVPAYHEYSLQQLLSSNDDAGRPIIAIVTQLDADTEHVSGMLLYLFEKESIKTLLDMISQVSGGGEK
ncbi:MAG: chemotaxis protein CheC [Coxiellaceae bacterium]|nr:chemotaxis protein CheC [Coxiellaceae bacterium]